jgi:hypothetical protein
MSEKKVAKPKVVKVKKEVAPIPELVEVKPKRASRAKPKPTKDEMLAGLKATSDELKLIIVDLKEDECKLQSMASQLKKVPELIKVTIQNLEDDCEDIDENYQQLLNCPVDQVSN